MRQTVNYCHGNIAKLSDYEKNVINCTTSRTVYSIFQTIRHTPIFLQNLGEKSVSYTQNVAYLARWGGGGGRGGWRWSRFFSPYFPPLKPRCVLWSGASYSPKVWYLPGLLNFLATSRKWFIHVTWISAQTNAKSQAKTCLSRRALQTPQEETSGAQRHIRGQHSALVWVPQGYSLTEQREVKACHQFVHQSKKFWTPTLAFLQPKGTWVQRSISLLWDTPTLKSFLTLPDWWEFFTPSPLGLHDKGLHLILP